MVFDVPLEMPSDSKNYVSVQDDEIRACAYYKIGMYLILRKFALTLLKKASFEPNEKMRCFFGIAKRF